MSEHIVILMYHGFVNANSPLGGEALGGRFIAIEKFREHVKYLKRHHGVVSMDSVVAHYREGTALPKRPVVITVDDGYASFYKLALPCLREENVPASLFVTTNFIDGEEMLWADRVEYAVSHSRAEEVVFTLCGRSYKFGMKDNATRSESLRRLKGLARKVDNATRVEMVQEVERQTGIALSRPGKAPEHLQPLTWDQIADSVKTGLVSVGNHTVSHPVLSQCSESVVRDEVGLAKAAVERRLNVDCSVFCYPFGTRTDFTAHTNLLVKEAGHRAALTTVAGTNDRQANLFEFRRYLVDGRMSWSGFVSRVSGLFAAPQCASRNLWGD